MTTSPPVRPQPRLRRFPHLTAVLVIAGASLGAIAVPWLQGESRPSPEASAEPGIWTVPSDACADSEVLEAVDRALLANTEGPENSLLATPDEVDVDARDRQARAWQGLGQEELAFQHCLRLQQTNESPSP